LQAQQESLYTMGADAGGKALIDQNNLAFGIVQAQKDILSSYILGYYSTNPALDGPYRRINVQVAKQLNAKLDYLPGYFASKGFRRFSSSDRQRHLQEALDAQRSNDGPVAGDRGKLLRLARDRYSIPVAVKIPGAISNLLAVGMPRLSDWIHRRSARLQGCIAGDCSGPASGEA
jgi:hypothetical protein